VTPAIAKTAPDTPVEDEAVPERKRPEPLVDLDDVLADRPTVRYQGEPYELKTLDDFGIIDQQRLTRDGREFFKLWSSDEELTEEEGVRLKLLLNRMFDKVFSAPKKVRDSLSDGKRAQVVLAFTLAPLARQTAALEQQTQEAADSSTTVS
jgi:hypothetical protein